MLHVVLLILKIIGIIIAVLLGLAILAVAAVFFVPIRYAAKAQYYNNVPMIQAKVTWLFHLLRIKCLFNLEEGLNIRVKVLFFTLKSLKKSGNDEENTEDMEEENIEEVSWKKTKKHRKKKEYSVFDEEEDSEEIDIFFDKPEETIEEKVNEDIYFVHQTADIDEGELEADEKETDELKVNEQEAKKTKVNIFLTIKNKIRSFIQKIKDFIQKIRVTKENVSQKTKKFSDVVGDPKNREMVSFLWIQIKKLWNVLKPKKVKAYLHFGFKDAETTGKAAMYAAVLYGFIGKNITIYPDFEQEIAEGNIDVKGSIQLFPIAMIALRIYRNKQVRKYIKHKV